MHSFFTKIKEYPVLEKSCRVDITDLPQAYNGKSKTKAILLGADPTNNGVKTDSGLKKLDFVFGINGKYENDFFSLQSINLSAIDLTKDDCYIQNVCQNYFIEQTTENHTWFETAGIWKQYLMEELDAFDTDIPLLATSNEVFTFLTGLKGPYTKIYSMEIQTPVYSVDFKRNVFPLFRGRAYVFYKDKWMNYRNFLKNYFAK